MDNDQTNVVMGNFGGNGNHPMPDLDQFFDELLDVLEKYSGKIPLALALGALEMAKMEMMKQTYE